MKRTLSFLLSLVMVIGIITSVPVTVNAASVNDLTFKLNESKKSYYVAACKESAKGKLTIPKKYNGKPVTRIGTDAFYWCNSLTSVTIPDSVTSIGSGAFDSCESLNSITIPDSVTSIGNYAFEYCVNLTSITIPNSVTSIGAGAFFTSGYYNDSSNWEDDVLYIGKHLIRAANPSSESYTIKKGTKTIADSALSYCENLTSVTIPDSITSIGAFSFGGCRNLTSITISNGVTTIGEQAFLECTNLKLVEIPGSVTHIGLKAFGYDYNERYDYEKIEKFTISGIENTAAEDYAKTNDFNFVKVDCKHKSTEWVTTKKATVNAAGSKYQKCTVCGAKLKTAKIAQLKCAAPKLKAVSNVATGIKLTWNKVTGADNYEIYRKTGKNAWKKLATVKGTVTTYTDKTAKSGTTYKYTVKAKNEAGLSKYNTTGLTIKCLADPVLKAPTSTKSGITLKWNKVTGAQGYMVYRQIGNGKLTKIATVKGVSKVSYVDKSAKKGTKYTYKLKAYSGKTYSAYSNAKTIKDKY